MRDWITNPRSTGYESLHLTVLYPDKKWIEVQIRSERMDEIAEKRCCSHYKYKEGFKQNSDDRNFEQWVSQIREVIEQQQNFSTTELLDNIKLNLFPKKFLFSHQKEKLNFTSGFYSFRFCVFSSHSIWE